MFDQPILNNDRAKIEAAYAASTAYLGEHKDLLVRIARYLWAYYQAGDLVPQTPHNFWSGHFFPFSESYVELENSYQLCLEGFYAHAFRALRTVLELGVLGVYFDVDDQGHVAVKPWLRSRQRTPGFRPALLALRQLPTFKQFDERFRLVDRIAQRYDDLGAFVHTRGYRHSASALSRANFNFFSEPALSRYCDAMCGMVADAITVLLLKYPIGMQGLPLGDKFGLDGPVGGFLEPQEVEWVTAVLPEAERAYLQELSDNSPDVQAVIRHIHDLPDLSADTLAQQLEEFHRVFPEPALPVSSEDADEGQSRNDADDGSVPT